MPRKARLNGELSTLLAAIEKGNNAAQIVADTVARELIAHTELDDSRHEENKTTLAAISTDVKSLLDSRSFTRGVWKAASTAGGLVAGAVMILGIVLQWWRGHF